MPSHIAMISAAIERYGFTAESTERYSNRPGAETRSAVVRFWKPQSANTGAQKPVSQRRRYEFTVGDGHGGERAEVLEDAADRPEADLARLLLVVRLAA